ncbi:MAG: NERD domain-containing protein [Lachnospiraceae bacterium]|nr:NERD domain-containing protein [Lachnospiraceae bacterium]
MKMYNNSNHSESIEDIYQKLTGVKIDEECEKWDARGKGYYGEYIVFTNLYAHIPGKCKILMNLKIPSENGKTTEIDLLLIHETGLYVFEVKHYNGIVYGKINESLWTQYFRTTPNVVFKNPVYQNRWHIEQLKKIYPSLPIKSFIVFSNPEGKVNVTGKLQNTTLCYSYDLLNEFLDVCKNTPTCLTMEQINDIFNHLKIYSPMQTVSVTYDSVNMDMFQFIEHLEDTHLKKISELEQTRKQSIRHLETVYSYKTKKIKQSYKKAKIRNILILISVIILCITDYSSMVTRSQEKVNSYIESCDNMIKQYQEEADAANAKANDAVTKLQEFEKKWELLTDFEIDGKKLKENFIVVDNISLRDSTDVDDFVNFSCELTHNGEDFYVLIDKLSQFIILLKDGRVIEIPCSKALYSSYSLGYSSVYKSLKIKDMKFTGFNTEDIMFIKLTNLKIKRINVYNEKPLLDNYEIVLFVADK